MKLRVVVLGAGFGGLEVAALLSEAIGDRLDLTLIDRNDSFFFGYSKLDVMFGSKPASAVRIPYSRIHKPGVVFRQEAVTSIDPVTRHVKTNRGSYDCDVLVVALGADYDYDATPGLAEGGNEFFSFAGAERLREVLPAFAGGRVVIGVASMPYKCPPAPSEAALLLDEYLQGRGIRQACEISLVIPKPLPVPPSPPASQALLAAFSERGITFIPNRAVAALDPERRVVILDDAAELPYDLFLGVPRHCVPAAVATSGLAESGWVSVDSRTLKTKYPDVYAIGDVAEVGTPKAGVFAEGEARVVAASILSDVGAGAPATPFDGRGSCYIEFGNDRVGRVDVDFFSGPKPTGALIGPSEAVAADKRAFGEERRARWFGV